MTRVYLTIDTECAEERGDNPALGYDTRVWGRFVNQRRALGIEVLMDTMEASGLRGTFFTEALGAAFFGHAGLAAVCQAIVSRGHDVQLHTHPRQIRADWRSRGETAAPDDIGVYPVAEQVELLRTGVATLEACGVPTGSVRAFRAGNFGASNSTWQALAQAGFTLDSSYNPSYFTKNCKMRFAAASVGLFRAEHGVWELPVSTFVEAGGGHRHAQITAVSFGEMVDLLEASHAVGIREVMIVTHSFELLHHDSSRGARGRPNRINVLRFRRLCRYLAANRDRFEVDTVGALATRLADGSERPSPTRFDAPRGRLARKLLRMPAQVLKRLDARLGIV